MTLLPCLPTKGERRAEVANPRLDTCSREVFRHEVRVGGSGERETIQFLSNLQELKDCVKLSRVRDHFICELIVHWTAAVRDTIVDITCPCPHSLSRVHRLLASRCASRRGSESAHEQEHTLPHRT